MEVASMTNRISLNRISALTALVALLTLSLNATTARAQDMTDDMVGQSEKAWRTWKSAMDALDKDKQEQAVKLLDDVAKMDLSPLRLALMADRTGTLRFEQAVQTDKAGASGK